MVLRTTSCFKIQRYSRDFIVKVTKTAIEGLFDNCAIKRVMYKDELVQNSVL